MRILFLNPFCKYGAVRQYNLAKALATLGHRVTLVLPLWDKYSDFKPAPLDPVPGLTIIHPRQFKAKTVEAQMAPYIPSAFLRLVSRRFDVVHGFRPSPWSGLLGYVLAKLKGVPFVFEIGDAEWKAMEHLGHPRYRVAFVKRLESFLAKRAAGITTMSDVLADDIQQWHNRKVFTVQSGIDEKKFSPENADPALRKKILAQLKTKNLLVYCGKLDKITHIRDIMLGLKRLPATGLVIVGDGAGKAELEALAKKEGVFQRCYFAGRVEHDKVPYYLNAGDVLVAPFSASEFGIKYVMNLKVLEYMGIGKPVLASDVGMLKRKLEGCGMVCQPDDLDDFTAKAKLLLGNAALRKKLGAAARKRILDENTWTKLAKKMVGSYDGLILSSKR